MTADIVIAQITEQDITGFHATLDSVARERIYLARTQAPPLESTAEFVRGNIADNEPQFVARVQDKVVGWCDVSADSAEIGRAHVGTLGMGVIADFRGQGIGERLMRTTVEAAIKKGITRIELEVRTGNAAAIKLYKKIGFELEGTRRAAGFQDGAYYDLHHMSLLAGDAKR